MFPKLTLAQVKNLIITFVVVGVFGSLYYYRDAYHDSKEIVKVSKKDVKAANQASVQAVKGSEIDQAAVVATADRVTNNANNRVNNERQHQERVRKIHQKHIDIPDTAVSAKQKSDELAAATIDSVWEAYCDVHPDDDCKE